MGLKDAREGGPAWACSSWLCGTLQTWPCQGLHHQIRAALGAAWPGALPAAFPSLPQAQGWEAVCYPDSSRGSNLALDLGLCLFSICQLLALLEFRAHILAGVRRCLRACGKGPPPAMTCCRWIAPVPPAKTAVVLLKNKASVSSGLLGIFSAKSPISPERNPEAGRPGGRGGESCCSTAATPRAL